MSLFDSLGGFVSLLIAVLAISGAAGAGFQRGKIGKLRGELVEADARADRLSTELTDTRAELREARTETRDCRRDLDALSRIVTGEAHWVAIGDQLDSHHEAATSHWSEQRTILDRIARAVEANA